VSTGLAAAVLAVLARDRDVATADVEAITRLAAPADAVAEVQLDPPHGALVPVIGFAAADTRPLLAEVAEAASAASDRAAEPATAPALRWLDAIAPSASHWGVKLGATRQIYARGHFDAAQAAALGGHRAADLDRLLAVTGVAHFAMVGIELADGAIARHVGYVAVTGGRAADALAAARGVAGNVDLLAFAQGWLHLSWDLATATGPFKIDAGPHQLVEAMTIAAALGLDHVALEARLAALRLGAPSHVGLRIGAPSSRALALYFRVTAS
jgi:hypothetical protein